MILRRTKQSDKALDFWAKGKVSKRVLLSKPVASMNKLRY